MTLPRFKLKLLPYLVHPGHFDNEDNANAYAQALHEAQAAQYGPQNPK